MNGTYIESVSERYIEGTRKFLGWKFSKLKIDNTDERINENVIAI
jgi:hypothetical protein